jgi:hypothetical protein
MFKTLKFRNFCKSIPGQGQEMSVSRRKSPVTRSHQFVRRIKYRNFVRKQKKIEKTIENYQQLTTAKNEIKRIFIPNSIFDKILFLLILIVVYNFIQILKIIQSFYRCTFFEQ